MTSETCRAEEKYIGLFEIIEHLIRDTALSFGGRRESRQVFGA